MKRNRTKIWEHLHDEDALNEPDTVECEYEDEYFYSDKPKDPYKRLTSAIVLAESLGYYGAYLDGAFVTNEWIDAMWGEITELVGSPWPEEVRKAYNEACDQGCLDT